MKGRLVAAMCNEYSIPDGDDEERQSRIGRMTMLYTLLLHCNTKMYRV